MDYIIQKIERKVKLKKRSSPQPISVKNIHDEMSNYFIELQESILPKKIKELKSKSLTKLQRQDLENEIKKIKNREEEFDYYFKTAKILDEYFLLDSGTQKEQNECVVNRKTEIVRQYYSVLELNTPAEYLPDLQIDHTVCKKCNSQMESVSSIEFGFICQNCGLVSAGIFVSDTLSYKDKQDTDFNIVLDYKRIDYFKQWINQIQAKEHTDIPREVIDTIIMQLKTERIKNTSNISLATMKRLLKKTNNSRYYEHIPYITNIINKVPSLNIPDYIETKLVCMFQAIQIPWEKLKTKDRKNFFSYPYTLHKFCQLLDLQEYLPYFPLLKSREKLYKQDIIWKRIMEYLQQNNPDNIVLEDVNWRYISSI